MMNTTASFECTRQKKVPHGDMFSTARRTLRKFREFLAAHSPEDATYDKVDPDSSSTH
jgi:hypothetical protein